MELPRTRLTAVFYPLVESASLARVRPRAYLAQEALRAIPNPGTVTLPTNPE